MYIFYTNIYSVVVFVANRKRFYSSLQPVDTGMQTVRDDNGSAGHGSVLVTR